MLIKEVRINPGRRPIDIEKVKHLSTSIREIGLLHPILLDEKNRLIAGLHRLEALKLLGREHLQHDEYRILKRSNLLKELVEIDENLMRNELSWQEEALALSRRKEIYEALYPQSRRGGDRGNGHTGGRQTDATSFCKNASDRIGLSERRVQFKVEIARIITEYPKLRECKTAAEAKFRYGRIRHEEERSCSVGRSVVVDPVVEGDCLEHLKELKDNSVACVLTDPPYGIHYEPVRYGEKQHVMNDDEGAERLLGEALEILKPKLTATGCVYVFCSWRNVDVFKRVIARLFEIKSILVWVKNGYGRGDCRGWAEKYELCIYATLGSHQLIGPRPVNVLEFNKTNRWHCCEKPVDLLQHIIEKSTVKNELVVDPFAGSGSTGVACLRSNRRFRLFELDPGCVKIIRERLAECGKEQKVLLKCA